MIVVSIILPRNEENVHSGSVNKMVCYDEIGVDKLAKSDIMQLTIVNMPYQERWRERPDETRQPVNTRCQIRRNTKDEDSIECTSDLRCAFFMHGKDEMIWRKDCLLPNVLR